MEGSRSVALRGLEIRRFDMHDNRFSGEDSSGARKTVLLLSQSNFLNHLNLRANRLTDGSAAAIANAIDGTQQSGSASGSGPNRLANLSSLQHLDLSENPHVGMKTAGALQRILQSHHVLQHLELSDCPSLGNQGATVIAAASMVSLSIKSLIHQNARGCKWQIQF